MTNVYVVQPVDYDSTSPVGVYTSIENALLQTLKVEQYGESDYGLNILCYLVDEEIATWEGNVGSGLRLVDRCVAQVKSKWSECEEPVIDCGILVELNQKHCAELNINPTTLVGDVAKEYGFKISKMTTGHESVVFKLTEDTK